MSAERFVFDKPRPIKPREYDARVVHKEWLTPDTLKIAFEPVGAPMFDFHAGQYVSIVLPEDPTRGLKRELRPYSMWNHPDEFQYVVTIAKMVDGGRCTGWLREAPEGAPLKMVGPLGSFVLRRPLHPTLLLVATGTGVVPVRALLKEMRATGELRDRDVTLLFGVRSQDDLFELDELRRYERDFERFTFVPTLSRPKPGWDGAVGRVTAHIEAMDLPVDAMQAYLCGNGAMINDAVALLEERGLLRTTRRIVLEKYFD